MKNEEMSVYLENLKLPNELPYKVVFLEQKDDGKFWYRKWIKNERHTVEDTDGEKYYALKQSGTFMHEDTMAEKFINPHKAIVVVLSDWDKRSADEIYIPNIGWKKSYEAQKIINALSDGSLVEAA